MDKSLTKEEEVLLVRSFRFEFHLGRILSPTFVDSVSFKLKHKTLTATYFDTTSEQILAIIAINLDKHIPNAVLHTYDCHGNQLYTVVFYGIRIENHEIVDGFNYANPEAVKHKIDLTFESCKINYKE